VIASLSWRYRVSRLLGRTVTRTAAILTLGHMPPFVSASVIVSDGENLLVVHDPVRDEYVLPGGHLHWSERPEEGAEREVREETGVLVRAERLLGVYAGREIAGEIGIVRVIYLGAVLGGSLQSSEEGEPKWVPKALVATSTARDAPIVRDWLALSDASDLV
jgi:ADP-ribose pyrophosphatase YjhB (NUDIX family)